MRLLLAQNSLYYPAHGGGDKSNRLLLEALAERGHTCRAVARLGAFGEREEEHYLSQLAARGVAGESHEGVVSFARNGVQVRVVANAHLRSYFAAQAESFRPDVILASTDDPAQLLLEVALRYHCTAPRSRIVYLVRATLAVPFGPDCAFPSEAKTARLRACDRVVGVSRYVADYCRTYGGLDAVHVPISLVEREEWPALARLENPFVVMANPCAVKGIAIFLGLADAFPNVAFAAVPTWGTNHEDRAALAARPNVRLLDPVDDLNQLFGRTRVLLVPSLWAEARSRIVLEGMLRGVPVMAADVGGIPEAKMGVPYLLPVNRIARYRPQVDEQMVPVAEVPPQDIGPWREALARLLGDPAHYAEIARQSRAAALAYAGNLSAEPLERILEEALREEEAAALAAPAPHVAAGGPALGALSADKRRLLALRLRRRAPASAWFPGIDAVPPPRLFWFPHAGGGSLTGMPADFRHVPVRLPGREARWMEAPFERMEPLVEALSNALEQYAGEPFSFFGHSMGAGVAFELCRELRRRGLPLPRMLIASSARAPALRRNHVPPPPRSDRELLEEMNIPPELASLVLPVLRADTQLYSHYVYREEAPLACPIRAYGGADDARVEPRYLEAWGAETSTSFAVRLFAGGHFYLRESAAAFRRALEEDVPWK